MRKSLVVIISSVALATFASACKNANGDPPSATAPAGSAERAGAAAPGPGSGAAPAGQAKATLSDPEIAAIVVAANQVDIDNGKLALEKSKNKEVRKFAQQMITDHTDVKKAAIDLVKKLNITPEKSDASKSLVSAGVEERAKLAKLDGKAFDRAYIDNEVAYHEAVIGVLASQLIPSTSNPELKSTLVNVKPLFDAHLQHAKRVQSELSRPGPVSSIGHEHGG